MKAETNKKELESKLCTMSVLQYQNKLLSCLFEFSKMGWYESV
jgi:hypothetical protein